MPIISSETLVEYKDELKQLLVEDNELADTEKVVTKRRDEIKTRVKNIAAVVGGEKERAILPVTEVGAWDRRVSFRDSGLDLSKLKGILGEDPVQEVGVHSHRHLRSLSRQGRQLPGLGQAL